MIDSIAAALAAMTALEAFGALLAVAYLVLAIRQKILCWAAALISSLLYVVVFVRVQLYMESVLNVFYAAMAVYGFYQWRFGGPGDRGLPVTTWPLRYHAVALALILALSGAFALALKSTDEAFPYLDSFTTVAAIVTTFMVAHKILENWIYWFVIDGLSLYMYLSRELYLTSLLFAFYLVLVVIGFRRWLADWQSDPAELGAVDG